MAARGTKTKTTKPDIDAGSVVLISGSEDLLVSRAIDHAITAARQLQPDAETQRLDAQDYEAGDLDQAASPSLFGGHTVVVLTGLERAADAAVTDLQDYLTSPSDEVQLVITHAGGNRAKGILDALRKGGAREVNCAPITRDDDKVAFVNSEFSRLGCRASAQAARALVDALGSDIRELASACAQLASDNQTDGRIDVDVVEQWCGGRIEVSGFKVADAVAAGRSDQALGLLRHALASGVDPVPLVAAVATKIRAIAKVSAVSGRPASVASATGLAPWQVDRARRELSGWSQEGLAAAIRAIAVADTEVKGGGRDPHYAVERLVLDVCQARRAG